MTPPDETEVPPPLDLERLKKMYAETSQGVWSHDTQQNKPERYGFEIMSAENGFELFDTANSGAAIIHEEPSDDGPGIIYWDETGRRNFAFIAEVHNAFPALARRIESLEELEKLVRIMPPPLIQHEWNQWIAALKNILAALSPGDRQAQSTNTTARKRGDGMASEGYSWIPKGYYIMEDPDYGERLVKMPKHDPRTDWTYSEGCGCKVTFFGESFNRTSRMTCCEEHAKRDREEFRDGLRRRAKQSLIEASN